MPVSTTAQETLPNKRSYQRAHSEMLPAWQTRQTCFQQRMVHRRSCGSGDPAGNPDISRWVKGQALAAQNTREGHKHTLKAMLTTICTAGSMLVPFVVVAKPRLVGQECCLGRLHSISVHRFVCLRTSLLSDWTILKDVTHSADVVLNSVTQFELVLSPNCILLAILLDGFMLSQLFSEYISSLCVRW